MIGLSEIHATNQVRLRGTLLQQPVVKRLASGEQLCQFRLNVPRPRGEPTRADTIDCAARPDDLVRAAQRWQAGDTLVLTGRLHRRFWRGASGLVSRFEVDVTTVEVRSDRRAAECR
jgi:single-strand DNA-binding protein